MFHTLLTNFVENVSEEALAARTSLSETAYPKGSERMNGQMFLVRKHNYMIITFAWATILAGLISVSLTQQPLWWITALLWGILITFAATLQILRPGYMRSLPLWDRRQTEYLAKPQQSVELVKQEYLLLEEKEHSPLMTAQIATAFEVPFQRMGVHTEEHRQEIEDAIEALFHFNADQQALSSCLLRLLQAAKRNWNDLAAFSPREQEILELLLQNVTYKEMGLRLHVSPSTIKTHIYHIFQKLEVSNREEAIRLITKRGWFLTNLIEA